MHRGIVALAFLALFAAGLAVGGVAEVATTPATAKDEIDLPALATQVAGLNGQVGYLYGVSLPGTDPNGAWNFSTYNYDPDAYGFWLVCADRGNAGTGELLRCTRPQPPQTP